MSALLLCAHGSRHPGAAATLAGLTRAVAARLPGPACGGPAAVRLTWLEFGRPDLAGACAGLAAAGRRRAVVAPLLFTEAFHRGVDLPAQAAAAAAATGVRLDIAAGLGLGEPVARALLGSARAAAGAAGAAGGADLLVVAVGSSDAAANAAVAGFARRLDGRWPGRVRHAFCVGAGAPRLSAELPAARARAAAEGRALVLAPLFTAPGLLWDAARRRVPAGAWAAAGPGRVIAAEPLGQRLAPVAAAHWAAAGIAAGAA